MNEKLIKRYVRLEGRINRIRGFKMKLYRHLFHMDFKSAYPKSRGKYVGYLENKLYSLKEPIRQELKSGVYYAPYDIYDGKKRYQIKSVAGDKRKIISIYTSIDYFESYLLYDELTLEDVISLLNSARINKLILNPTTLNVVINKSALKEPIAVIIYKNKLKLEG